ncbi:TPA: hypothetical protein ACLAWC_002024, partial [Neisseria meningitidis]
MPSEARYGKLRQKQKPESHHSHSRESGSFGFSFLGFGQLLNRHSHAGGNLGLSARELMRRHSRDG